MHNPTQLLKIQVLPNPSEGILIFGTESDSSLVIEQLIATKVIVNF